MMETTQEKQTASPEPQRKPYSTPRFQEYGDLAELTKSGPGGFTDGEGGSGPA